MLMHVPLLARSRLPTFNLYRNIIFLSRKIKHVKIIYVKFKTLCLLYLCKIKCYKALSSLQHVYFAFVISGNPPASRLPSTQVTTTAWWPLSDTNHWIRRSNFWNKTRKFDDTQLQHVQQPRRWHVEWPQRLQLGDKQNRRSNTKIFGVFDF